MKQNEMKKTPQGPDATKEISHQGTTVDLQDSGDKDM